MKKTLWHLIASTRGGTTRVRIIQTLSERPHTASQLAERIDFAYNTVRYHLEVLEEHDIVEAGEKDYGKMYYLTDKFTQYRDEFDRIVDQTMPSSSSTRRVSTNEH